MAPGLQIQELDATGHPKANYEYDASTGTITSKTIIPATQTGTSLMLGYMSPFLPAGYPVTVTPDYTPYQIYDSLQAFASTIAGLLASRAVFVGMGVGSEDASLVTTMLLYIAQATIGRVATILFADRFSQRIEADVKFYRFFADIVNDIAFVLDCISPSLPILGRAITLCVSNACRALCGVAGGSSKAILSTHFAKAGNIGELNAKDGSQETVVSLIGMWVGGLVVSKVEGNVETWGCLVPLLALHLWCNWKAVKSVRLASLNTERAVILFDGLLRGQIKGLDAVALEEAILGRSDLLRTQEGQMLSSCKIGVGVDELLHCMHSKQVHASSEAEGSGEQLSQLFGVFKEERYLLWCDVTNEQAVIILKEEASGETQAKAFLHLMRVLRDEQGLLLEKTVKVNRPVEVLRRTLDENNRQWKTARIQFEQAGWQVGRTALEKGRVCRIREGRDNEDKKEK